MRSYSPFVVVSVCVSARNADGVRIMVWRITSSRKRNFDDRFVSLTQPYFSLLSNLTYPSCALFSEKEGQASASRFFRLVKSSSRPPSEESQDRNAHEYVSSVSSRLIPRNSRVIQVNTRRKSRATPGEVSRTTASVYVPS